MIEICDIYWHLIEMMKSCVNPVNSQFWLKNNKAIFGQEIVWPILAEKLFGQFWAKIILAKS
jgi:hypothetical protein